MIRECKESAAKEASPSWILWTAWVCWPAPARWPVAISTCFFTWLQRNSLGSSSRRFWLPRSTKYYHRRNQEATSDLQHDCWFSVWPPKCLLSLPSQQFDRHLPLFWATLPVKGNNPLDLLTVGHTQASFACFYTFKSQISLHVLCCACRRMIQAIQKPSKTAKQLVNTICLWHCNYKRNKWTKRRSASPSWILRTAWVCWPAPARWPVAISTCFFTWRQRNSLGSSSRRFWLPRSTKYYHRRNQEATSDLQHDCWFSVWPPKCLLSLPSQQFDRHLPLFWATLPVKGNNPLDLLTVGHTQASFACFYTFKSQISLHVLCCACRRMIQAIQKPSKTAKQLVNTICLWHCNYKRNKWTKRRSASPSWILWTAWVCWPAPARWPVAISTCFFTWRQRNSLGSSSRRFWLPRSTKYYHRRNQEATSDLQHDCWFSVWPPKCLLSLPSQQFDRHLPLFWATLPDQHCPKCLELLGEHESDTESIPTYEHEFSAFLLFVMTEVKCFDDALHEPVEIHKAHIPHRTSYDWYSMMYEVNPGLVIQLLNCLRQIGYLQTLIHLLKTRTSDVNCDYDACTRVTTDRTLEWAISDPQVRHVWHCNSRLQGHFFRASIWLPIFCLEKKPGSPAVEKKPMNHSHVKCQMAAIYIRSIPLARMPVINPKADFEMR